MTWIDLARQVAAEYRLVLLDWQADFLLWEHTGFPSFWRRDPESECRVQLRELFERPVKWPKW